MSQIAKTAVAEIVSGGPCKASGSIMDLGHAWPSRKEGRMLAICANRLCMRQFEYEHGGRYPAHEVLPPTPEQQAEFDAWVALRRP